MKLAFVLVPGFSLVTFGCALEAFRLVCDRCSPAPFIYRTVAVEGLQVPSNDGVFIAADEMIGETKNWDIVFVISSLDSVDYRNDRLTAWLRRLARNGVNLSPLGSATVMAAELGLMDGYRCVTHWHFFEDFQERFPGVELIKGLYCIDRERLTCAGGFSAMDLGMAVAASVVGAVVVAEIAEFSMLSRIRQADDYQRMSVQWRFGIHDERLARVIETMENNIQNPVDVKAIADMAGLSKRQLNRIINARFGKSPHRLYLEIRLRRSDEMLKETCDSIAVIAHKCGFADNAHFSRQFKSFFLTTPAAMREKHSQTQPRWSGLSAAI